MNHEPPTTNQHGVATILAIGITALLLCLAIAYVTTSIVEKKAATNYQSMITSRVAAQTAFNRAIAQMKDASTNPQESFNQIVSHRAGMTSWTNADTESLAAKLTTIVNGYTYYSLPTNYPTGYTASDSSAVSWVYIKADPDSRIVGRVAYVVIPDKGKIDPWSVIDSGVNAALYSRTPPSEVDYGGASNRTSVDAAGNYVIGRPGRDLTELSLESLETDPTFLGTYTQKMSVKTCSPAGLVDTGPAGDWVDYEQIFSKLGISVNDDTTRNYFRNVFYVNAQPDPEAFWIDLSNDSIRDPSELYHRFNLARTDWANIRVDSFLVSDGTKFQYSLIGESNYLPWLKNWNYQGDFPSVGSARRQIIANLIDYCKSTDTPTTDYNPPTTPIPTYVGLNRVPYLNRVAISVRGTIVGVHVHGNTYQYTFTTQNPVFTVQIVNMYQNGVVKSVQAVIDSTIQFRWGNTDVLTTIDSRTATDTSPSFNSALTTTNNGYSYSNFTVSYTPLVGCTITGRKQDSYAIQFNITNLKVKLISSTSPNVLYDYSEILSNDTTWRDVVFIQNKGSGTYSSTLSDTYNAGDPRQNQFTTDWTYTATSAPLTGNNSNYNANPGGATDPEPSATYPHLISTAYLRKGPMQSPWELGFIHRAKAYQTLNLKKYNNLASNGYGFGLNSGGSAYSDGDANILDQIKMTSNTTTLGKINVNSDNLSVLRALFDNIKLGSDLKSNPDPGVIGYYGTTTITPANANTIADSIRTANGSQGTGTPFYTRASVVNPIPYLSTTTLGSYSRTTDAKQEELIGKFINLAKAETPDQYIVIAVGEAIRDVANTGTYEPNVDEILASQKILAIIKHKFDPTTNQFYVVRMMYLSE